MSLVCLGVVVAAHGVRGQVKVKCFTERTANIAAYGPLSDETGARRWKVRVVGEAKGAAILAMDGVADRNAAEALKGTRLFVPRAALPATVADEFYETDLVGLRVENRNGTAVGQVDGVFDFGAGTVLEVARAGKKPAMLPFTREAVPVVDLAGGRVVIDPPANWLDEDGVPEARAEDEGEAQT
ncbi:MAG TPA: ribosome maturation factor RimM [Candidatus Cybelea sp.]|nr:ribosome maturation factor RimM [Candidatus Cybelea sp.]